MKRTAPEILEPSLAPLGELDHTVWPSGCPESRLRVWPFWIRRKVTDGNFDTDCE